MKKKGFYLVSKNAMVAAFCAEGEIEMFGLAERRFNDSASWNTLISGYFQNGCQVKPLKLLFVRGIMVLNGMRILLLSFLSVCADLRNLKIGKIKTMLVLEYEVCRVIALQWTGGPRSLQAFWASRREGSIV